MSNDAGKRPLAIVMAITADLAFAAATVLRGLRRFPPADDYDVILHHGGVRGSELELLGGLHPCRFERYRCPAQIRRLIPPASLRAFSDQAFAKYECFDLLAHYSQVLWLDADLLIRGDTTELLERGRHGAAAGIEFMRAAPERLQFNNLIVAFTDCLAQTAWTRLFRCQEGRR